jgi:hypothetical protein
VFGVLVLDDAGIVPGYTLNGDAGVSFVTVSLQDSVSHQNCSVSLQPSFVRFDFAHTSTRSFETVVFNFSNGALIESDCPAEANDLLARLQAQFGDFIVGFATARFAADRPRLDVYLNASKPIPGTASITVAGGGRGYFMDGGVVTSLQLEPPLNTLPAGYYKF